MKKLTLKTIAVSAISLMTLSMGSIAFAAGEKMINTSAGKSYAGYGYTHGYVPVTVGTGGYYDRDIMKYDLNNSQYLYRSPFYYSDDQQQAEKASQKLQQQYDENQEILKQRNGYYN